MPNKSLSRSGLLTYQKYSSLLAGNEAYIPAGPAYDLLETVILTGSQSIVEFTNIAATYGADYQHLQVRATSRTDRTGAHNEPPKLNINSDTGTNYSYHSLYAYSTGFGSSNGSTQNRILLAEGATSASSVAGSFGVFVLDILNPFETDRFTTVRAFGGYKDTSLGMVQVSSGLWQDTAAVSTLTFDQLIGSNFLTGSRFSLYGWKA